MTRIVCCHMADLSIRDLVINSFIWIKIISYIKRTMFSEPLIQNLGNDDVNSASCAYATDKNTSLAALVQTKSPYTQQFHSMQPDTTADRTECLGKENKNRASTE